jgi:putative glycosyltransferase (TIGR04372 family)
MTRSQLHKTILKNLLSSEKFQYCALRNILSTAFFGLAALTKPLSLKTSGLLGIYGCIFSFNPNQLAGDSLSSSYNLDRHLVVASRAFFEIAFRRGELLQICNFLKKTTNRHPNLYTPWKLLHYCYYFTKSWELLWQVNVDYEKYRKGKLTSAGILGYDIIVGDHITSSIGHSLIFFDFQILASTSVSDHPKIGLYSSSRDKMSTFYKKIVPDVVGNTISAFKKDGHNADFDAFIQDSFPFLVTKKYFNYSEERGRAKYLASWAATGAKAFTLNPDQRAELSCFLQSLGLSKTDWYVVVHVRQAADGSIRNADINTYYEAFDAITSNGGWVFRIGDIAMTPLQQGMSKVIDLPFSKLVRPNYLDLYLLATARFVISTCSGPNEFPFYFNVPRLMTNRPFMSQVSGTLNDICLPVSYYCTLRKAIIPLREQLTSATYQNEPNLNSLRTIIPIRNSSKQIHKASIEMIERTAKNLSRASFPVHSSSLLNHASKNDFWFMGSIAESFLQENPSYLD